MPNDNDHDMLVTLNTKVDQLGFDIKDLKNDLLTRMVKAESRLDAIDIYHAKIPLDDYEELARWVERIKANFSMMIVLGGILVGMIGGIIERLLAQWFHF